MFMYFMCNTMLWVIFHWSVLYVGGIFNVVVGATFILKHRIALCCDDTKVN